jgi:hypothetical protein
MAIPLFNVMTGDRGIEGAQNVLSAMLQRARARAIAIQEPRGLFFFENPATGEYMTCVVKMQPTDFKSQTLPALELDPQDDEAVPLGRGVGLVAVFPYPQAGTNFPNRYQPYGVVMFDGLGRIQPTNYTVYVDNGVDPTKSAFDLIRRFRLLDLQQQSSEVKAGIFEDSTNCLMLYGRSNFQKQADDTAKRFGAKSRDWLDQNGSTQVVNRYNGTLIKGD